MIMLLFLLTVAAAQPFRLSGPPLGRRPILSVNGLYTSIPHAQLHVPPYDPQHYRYDYPSPADLPPADLPMNPPADLPMNPPADLPTANLPAHLPPADLLPANLPADLPPANLPADLPPSNLPDDLHLNPPTNLDMAIEGPTSTQQVISTDDDLHLTTHEESAEETTRGQFQLIGGEGSEGSSTAIVAAAVGLPVGLGGLGYVALRKRRAQREDEVSLSGYAARRLQVDLSDDDESSAGQLTEDEFHSKFEIGHDATIWAEQADFSAI